MLDIVCEHLFTDFSDQRDATLSSISADDICYIQISNKRNYFPFIENSTYCFNKGKRNWKITFFVELMIPSWEAIAVSTTRLSSELSFDGFSDGFIGWR